MGEPFDVAKLPELFAGAQRRTLAVAHVLLAALDGEPVAMTPAAFKQREAVMCSTHPAAGLTTVAQYQAHLRRHHARDFDPCPHCGWDLRVVGFDPYLSVALPNPVQVVIIEGIRTRRRKWQGAVSFAFVAEVCPQCRNEVKR